MSPVLINLHAPVFTARICSWREGYSLVVTETHCEAFGRPRIGENLKFRSRVANTIRCGKFVSSVDSETKREWHHNEAH